MRKRCQLPLNSAGGERRTRLHRVAADRVEPEFGTEQLAVDTERVTSKGARPKREDRDTPGEGAGGESCERKTWGKGLGGRLRKEVPESVEVAGERVRVSEEEVREPDRLSALPSRHRNRSKNGQRRREPHAEAFF